MGIDKIPYKVLKNHDAKLVIYKLLETLFEDALAPSMWLTTIITPVPKGADKDPCIPLNYRGTSLLSCVYKIYTCAVKQQNSCWVHYNLIYACIEVVFICYNSKLL